MNDYGSKNVSKEYEYVKTKDKENCADLAYGIGKAGDIAVTDPKIKGSGITHPDKQYENLLEEEKNRKNEIEEFKKFIEEQKKLEENGLSQPSGAGMPIILPGGRIVPPMP
jgi:hypothetical protein